MSDKVSFSSVSQTFEKISDYHKVISEALRKYYNVADMGNPIPLRFIGLSIAELEKELGLSLYKSEKL